jgi:hypothetical protein
MITLHKTRSFQRSMYQVRTSLLRKGRFDSFPLAIDVSLATCSRKTIKSIQLRKNNESLRDVQKTISAGGVHREDFHPPL